KAVRAVASAVAQNPIAMLVPCHRIIHKDGTLGEYHWGRDLKKQLLDWEKNTDA
ncbi:MAG: methylated-DNA--[protein]-cysteine S-methyltransferase, partial [Prevotella sp.]